MAVNSGGGALAGSGRQGNPLIEAGELRFIGCPTQGKVVPTRETRFVDKRPVEHGTLDLSSEVFDARIAPNEFAHWPGKRPLCGRTGPPGFDIAQGRCAMHILQMEKLLPEEDWIGRFFDSRGYWHYACAELMEKNPAEKRKLLDSAEQDLERALRRDEGFLVGSNIRQEHLALVRQAISKLHSARSVAEPSAPVGA